MWHVISFTSGLDWKRPAKENDKLPASSNENWFTAGHRPPAVFNKDRAVESSHHGPRDMGLPRRSPSPVLYMPRPEIRKANADAVRTRSTRCIQRSGDATESSMSSTSPVAGNGQSMTASIPKELLGVSEAIPNEEIQLSIYTTFDNNRKSVWDDPEVSPDSNGWYAEHRRWEASLDLHMSPENNEKEDTAYLFTETFTPSEPLCPVTVPAPFGSGRKEKVKLDQEYSASSAALGYKGSYSQYPTHANVGSSRGRVNGDDPNGNNNGSGSGDRRGGGGGDEEDNREADSEQVAVASQSPPDVPTQQQEIQQRPPLRYGEPRSALLSNPGSIWCCCNCYRSSNSGALNYQCWDFDCQHMRCENCPIEFVRSGCI